MAKTSESTKKEAEFEQDLINSLCSGKTGPTAYGGYRKKLWTYRDDLKTTADLWQNFADILYRNNQDKLDHPLSITEFDQVKKIINGLTTPFKAGQFLYGYNGVSQVEVDLDDGRHVFLTVFDQSQVGAGNTVYEVANQIERPAIIPGKKDRRFDVTLLINGLPIVQIELKAEKIDVNDALNQMHNYMDELQYTDIYSTIQILVAMTPYDCKYMANTTSDRFNKDFAFRWQRRSDNGNVYKWQEFADLFLSIPAAHRMSTTYMILDGTRNEEGLKVMRPYQVYATEAVIESIKQKVSLDMGVEKLGYIWHTTGSGKTITSFKTAWLATRLPGVDKVVFVVDRKQLTRQTFEKYRAYDPEYVNDDDVGKISDVHNTTELANRLKSKRNDIVVTTTQKLYNLVKRKTFKSPEKNIIFIVDEAHRSTNSDKFAEIQNAFKRSGWIGYTGTPTFDTEDGGRPTKDVFGEPLHEYTIREAIEDSNVLGFKVDFEDTIPETVLYDEILPKMYKDQHPDWTEEQISYAIGHLTPDQVENDKLSHVYDNYQPHVEAVVKDIFSKWKNRSNDGEYNALLTTHVSVGSSIKMALMYYDEIQKVNHEHEKTGETVLKTAILVTEDDTNSDDMMSNNKGLEEAVTDYSQLFGTHFDMRNYNGYKEDVVSRLDKSADDGNYLDLCIVVNQLLTGFDAPGLNTIYVDRVLHGAGLIQAYSRTNRIENMQDKPWGQVVNYRWPKQSENEMNLALTKYSNKENAHITYGDQGKLIDDNILAKPFKEVLNETKLLASELRVLTKNFDHIPTDDEDRNIMLEKLQKYNSNLSKLKQYPLKENEDGTVEGYDYEHPEKLIHDIGLTEDESKILSTSLTNELKRVIGKKQNIPPSDVDLTVVHLKEVHVDYKYLTELIEKLMKEVHNDEMKKAQETRDKIREFASSLENPEFAKAVRQAADAIYEKLYPSNNALVVINNNNGTDVNKVIQEAQTASVHKMVLDFRNKWGITDVISSDDFLRLIANHDYGEQDLDEAGKMNDIIYRGSLVYQEMSTDDEVKALRRLKYRNALRQAIYDFANEYVME
ncbi:type I restriction endonuclease subunit R [Lactimicrobium massiliense]|uniref:type I restriction endonuclease subunit R n=1 Tax=Lactimicrobium massiliense TaxID=2161814 RepID=UPI000D5568AF|nr:HsdR family type I site-specific deoxyribonuclease [Lactimicrobium massiliense]